MQLNATVKHPRSGEHYARVERERQEGESFTDALYRVAVEDALIDGEGYLGAARLLDTSRDSLWSSVKRMKQRGFRVRSPRAERTAMREQAKALGLVG